MILPGPAVEEFSGLGEFDAFENGFAHIVAKSRTLNGNRVRRLAFNVRLLLGNHRDKPLREASGRRFKSEVNSNQLQELVEFFQRQASVGFLPASEAHINSYFIPLGQELGDLHRAHLEVMLAGGESNPNAPHPDLFLFSAVFAFKLLMLILELAEIHDPADRRVCGRRYFN